MSSRAQNSRVIQKGFDDFSKAINKYVIDSLTDAAEELLVAVVRHRTFTGFTGNTQTSYACGVYVNGSCQNIILQQNWMESPRRLKIQYGELVFLNNPYEGEARATRGSVDTSQEYGQDTSVRFLLEHKCPKDGWGLVMTTGTEYSEFLETINGFDVLTGTAEESYAIISKSFKPMPAEWQ